MRTIYLALLAAVAGCTEQPGHVNERNGIVVQDLTAAVRKARSELIRDSAAEMGVHNAALFGGIAISETQLAHCWDEATYACKGPASSSCGGGPIIAGSADGPCSDQQGGLGMFQFDAGTYSQTLATYGERVLTVEGNTAQAVAFVVTRAIQSIDGVNSWMEAVDWMNTIPMNAGNPLAQAWGRFMACRYNGCCSTSSLCTSRANGYRDNAIALFEEMGADFWKTADRCAGVPADGIIDQRSACYLAGGEPRYWRREEQGYGNSREWTGTTSAAGASNFARWIVKSGGAATYKLAVHVTGGEARTARYRIVAGGATEVVEVDQSTADGWVELGTFAFAGEGAEYVELGDNTGTDDQRLVFDALAVTGPDGDPPAPGDPREGDEPEDPNTYVEGGCSSSGGPSGALALGLLALRRRRRR